MIRRQILNDESIVLVALAIMAAAAASIVLRVPLPASPEGFAPDTVREERPLVPMPALPAFWLAPQGHECSGDGQGGQTPEPGRPAENPGNWLDPNDYPASAMARGQQGITAFRLAVNDAGRASDCAVLATSGVPKLDAAACHGLLARSRFIPARDDHGCPVPFSYEGRVRWQLPR